MVDTVSSLGAIEYRHDEWNVDVTVAGSQKGLMLPPGLSFNAISARALAAGKTARLPRWYWNWEDMLELNASGFFPYTPATNLLFGLREALAMLHEEGLERFDMSLGAGLGKLKGKIFRTGHLGDFNDLMLAGTLCGVEMGLVTAGVPITKGGVTAALDYLGGVGD